MLAALLLSAAAPAALLAPRMEILVEQPAATRTEEPPAVAPERQCTDDKRWCMELAHDADLNTVELHVFDGRKPREATAAAAPIWSYPLGEAPYALGPGREYLGFWSQIIREPSAEQPSPDGERLENIIVGLRLSDSTMYSGGGGHSETLTLYRLQPSGFGEPALQEMLKVPLSANIMIRACFSEQDFEQRRGACHDEYSFDATLSLDKRAKRKSPPQLIYQTIAIATPGNSRRMEDNLEKSRLSEADLKPATDPKCSYRRIVTYNPVTARYEFDRPGPDCSDYTVP
jgi:hypothetical protein